MTLLIFIAFAPIIIMPITIICLIVYSNKKTVVLGTSKRLQEEGPGDPRLMDVGNSNLDIQCHIGSMTPEPWYTNPPMCDPPVNYVPEQKTIIVKQGLSIEDIMKYELLDHIWR